MDRNRNTIIEIDGTDYGFRIDTWVLKQVQIKTGCKGVVETLNKIGVNSEDINLDALSILIMEAHNEYLHFSHVKNKDITDRQACDLIDEMGGVVPALEKLSEGFETHLPKNSQPPQTVGEISQ